MYFISFIDKNEHITYKTYFIKHINCCILSHLNQQENTISHDQHTTSP